MFISHKFEPNYKVKKVAQSKINEDTTQSIFPRTNKVSNFLVDLL
jgi:hypothetical protein